MAIADQSIFGPGAPLVATYGEPPYDRRLSDKILAAFNHAYAEGETAVAAQLHAALAAAEARSRSAYPERRDSRALAYAERWMAFVEARNRYRASCERPDATPEATAAALAAMKQAYKAWSLA